MQAAGWRELLDRHLGSESMTGLPAAELSQIPMSQALAATLARASEGAKAARAAEVTLEHVLAALCDDPDAADVLAASNIDAMALRAETINYLSRLALRDAPPSREVLISAGVRRILEAAAAAARGGRRRDINGAIVLAAIVGDGRSAAAQMLQVRGLTFDGAIRALQAAMAQPSRENPPQNVPADDVLARARERVQSRAAPSLRDIMNQMPRATSHSGQSAPQTDIVSPPDALQPATNAPKADSPRPAAPLPSGKVPADSVASESPQGTVSDAAKVGDARSKTAKRGDTDSEPSEENAGDGMKAAAPEGAKESTPAAAAGAAAKAEPAASMPPGPASPQHGAANRPAPQPQPNGRQETANAVHPAPGPSSAPAGSAMSEAHAAAPAAARKSTAMPPPIPPPIPRSPQPGGMPMGGPLGGMTGGPGAGPGDGRPTGLPASRPVGGQQPGQRMPMPPSQRPQVKAARPPLPGGMLAPAPEHNMRAPAARREAPAKAELGELAENVPRAMRVGVSERVEIRIARGRVQALTEGMEGGGLAWRHDVTITKAMSVRLRAPEGGFFIESASPETQWIDSQFQDVGDDYASWRFQVTPNRRGWAPLQIIVSARTVGADGLAAETAFPDQVIEVKVKSNLKRAFARWSGWIAAAILGGVLARFGEGAFDAGSQLVAKFLN